MAREEKRPSGRKSFGDKSFGGKSAASSRSGSGSRSSSSKFKKEGDSSSRPKKSYSSSSSDKPKSYRGAGDFKKSFGEKSFGDKPFAKKTYGEKSGSDYKPKRAVGGKSEGGYSAKPKRDGSFRTENKFDSKPRFGENKTFGDKPSYNRKPFGDKPSFGDQPKRSFRAEGESGEERRSFGRKPFGETESSSKREGGFRRDNDSDSRPRFSDKKTFGEKKAYGDKKSYGDKPSYAKKSFGDKKPFGDKPSFGDKPKRSFGGENEGGEEKRSFGRKPFGESSSPRLESKKSFGSRFNNEDIEKRTFERETPKKEADRPFKSFDKGEKLKFGDKKSFDEKPKRGFGQRNNFDSESKKATGFDDFKFDKPKKSDDDFIASDFEKAAKYVDDAPKVDKKRPSKLEFTESVSDSRDGIRLNKYIANSGICSRREADVLISQGLVSVNNVVVTELGVIVKRNDVVKYDGRTLNPEKNVYLLLNKPKDFITTTNDPQERKTVMNLISNACKERIYPVGRLDRNTTGLLLFTNDGELAEKLTHPSHEVKKIYQVELDRPISPEEAQAILDGLYFEEGKAIVDSMAVLDESKKVVGIEIHIGWNRIVRRIFEAKGFEVVRLDRVLYAGLTKKDLPRGEWRFLTDKEVVALKYPQRG